MATTTHQGWVRQRKGPWTVCCSAESEAACWRRTLDFHAHEACVLPVGRRPDDKPKRKRPVAPALFAEDAGPYGR